MVPLGQGPEGVWSERLSHFPANAEVVGAPRNPGT